MIDIASRISALEVARALAVIPGEIRITHRPTGWAVDPITGIVYGAQRKHRGQPLGRPGTSGYLTSGTGDRHWLIHRVVWEACVGPIPEGWQVNHCNGDKLDNRLLNLEACTPSHNIRHAYDMRLRGRRSGSAGRRGESHPMAKLTADQVDEIRARYETGQSQVSLAGLFGVSQSTVWRAVHGLAWSKA